MSSTCSGKNEERLKSRIDANKTLFDQLKKKKTESSSYKMRKCYKSDYTIWSFNMLTNLGELETNVKVEKIDTSKDIYKIYLLL